MMNKKFIMRMVMLGCMGSAMMMLGCNNSGVKEEAKTDVKVEASRDTVTGEVKHNTDTNILVDTKEYRDTDKPIILDEYNGVTISEAGTYILSGNLKNGQVIVDANAEDEVTLVLDNVNISCENSYPIYINSAKKIVISSKETSNNYITLKGENSEENSNKNLYGIYSMVDMEIRGVAEKSGLIEITSECGGGIASEKSLLVENGQYKIDSKANGILVQDSVDIKDAKYNIYADENGIYANKDVAIERADINISSKKDGIVAMGDTGIFETTMMGYAIGDAICNEDAVSIVDSNTIIRAGKSGIDTQVKATISEGEMTINADDDAIKASKGVAMLSADIDMTTESTAVNSKWDRIYIEDVKLVIRDAKYGLVGNNVALENVEGYITTKHDAIWTVNDNSNLSILDGDIMMNCKYSAIHSEGDVSLTKTGIAINTKEDGLKGESMISIAGQFTNKDSVVIDRENNPVNMKRTSKY